MARRPGPGAPQRQLAQQILELLEALLRNVARHRRPGSVAAAVPGRGEYLNEKPSTKPTSRTRARVSRKSASVSPGKADDQVGGEREVGPGLAQRRRPARGSRAAV